MAKTNAIRTTDKQQVKEITDRLEEGLRALFENEAISVAERRIFGFFF